MGQISTKFVKAALRAAHFVGAERMLAPITRGLGVIFMLHQVNPQQPNPFDPNKILKITPAFLDAVIQQVREAGFDIVGLDDVPARIVKAKPGDAPFACFTLDDGYRDNREHAYPVFKRHNAPFALYIASDFADGTGMLWWFVLQETIARAPYLDVQKDGVVERFAAVTVSEKSAAFESIYWWLRRLPENRARYVVAELAHSIGYDWSSMCSDLVMNWDELRAFAADPLVTVGAHTCSHFALGGLDKVAARVQMLESKTRIEQELGRPCRHVSYPYGCARSAGRREFDLASELGFETGVTTRKSVITKHHSHALTALPRLSLNGDYQDVRYTQVILSGAPFAIMNAIQRT